jgi:endoglucanase
MNTFDVLKKLTDARGVAGNESAAANAVLEILKEIVPNCEASLDCHGSVVGLIKRVNDAGNTAAGGHADTGPVLTILLDAHIDQVGLIVTHIDDKGFIRAEPCGGIDRRALAAQAVTIHAKSPLKGVICTLPPHVDKDEKVKKADEIRIDAGLSKKRADELISLGDVVTIDGELVSMLGKVASGPALDDRAGVVAILYALHLLKIVDVKYNIAVSFSVQEELGCRGAGVVVYNTEPDLAIVVDVSYGTTPGCSSVAHKCGELGKGPMIGYAPALSREMFEGMKKIAAENEISYQLEIMNGDTGGTNADSVTTVKGGVRTSLLSIPLRYMHTPVETADLSDIEATGKLIARFVEDFRL